MWGLRARGHRVVVLVPAETRSREYVWRGFPAAPDPIDIATSAADIAAFRQRENVEAQVTWFGVFGNVSARKNLPLIAQSLATHAGSQVGLLVAGKVEPKELKRAQPFLDEITRAGGRVIVLDRLLTDSEIDSAIGSVDAAVLAHSTDGPSGILGKSARLGTTVLAAGAPALKRDVARLQCGSWSTLTVDGIGGMIDAFLRESPPQRPRELADAHDFARALVPRTDDPSQSTQDSTVN
ncbi:hypothetical protein GCM10017690_08320 [Microbacterium terregens]